VSSSVVIIFSVVVDEVSSGLDSIPGWGERRLNPLVTNFVNLLTGLGVVKIKSWERYEGRVGV